MLNHLNQLLWRRIFESFSIFSDHIAVGIVLFALTIAVIFAYFSVRNIGKMTDTLLIFPFLSICHMLRHLAEIHPRLYLMTHTVSTILISSDDYLKSFMRTTGKRPDNEEECMESLMLISKKQMEKMRDTEPRMLYEKLESCFHSTKDLLGYLDQIPHHHIYLIVTISCTIFLIICYRKTVRNIHEKIVIVFEMTVLLLSYLDKAGEVLSCVVFIMAFHLMRWFFRVTENPHITLENERKEEAIMRKGLLIDKRKLIRKAKDLAPFFLFAAMIILTNIHPAFADYDDTIKDVMEKMIGVVETIFKAVGAILGVYSAGQLILAFKNEDADSKSRASTMLVVAIALIAMPGIVESLKLTDYITK